MHRRRHANLSLSEAKIVYAFYGTKAIIRTHMIVLLKEIRLEWMMKCLFIVELLKMVTGRA